ncbi:bile acid-CoA:amino acid N-acyltransferase-like isoform X2 [Babylonia areolata]|uniref:bile acid-CoA:amino acid N-acyltransferase-like isoform X2 n=1 Tax=Babylonia areolata TaxID=304850 RepID=UPI003FD00DAE
MGVDPMGPFWSLTPCPSGPQNIRMVVRNGEDPILYTLSICLDHCSLHDLVAKETTHKPLVSTSVSRLKKAADVRRIPVKEGGVRGVLFLPPGDGPHPGVIDMFGSAGGLMETRAALLASHGFAVLALPFFRFDDLPQTMDEISFDYFEETVSWFNSHKAVKDGIGLVGVSKGGEFVLLLAWKCPQVKAAVVINSIPSYGIFDLHRKDGALVWKGLKLDASKMWPTEEGMSVRDVFTFTTDSFIPVWESSAHILMMVSDDDHQLHSELADKYHSAFPEDRRHLMEVVHYPGAGHLLEPPYTPHCRACVNPAYGVDFMWGGNSVDHAAAQEESWTQIQKFLKTHLSD